MAADCTPLAGPTGLSCKSQDPGLGGAVYIGKRGLDPSHRFRRELADARLETAPGFRGVTAGALTSRSAILSVGAGLASLVTHRSPVAPARGKRHLRISLTGKAQKPSPVSTCGVCAAPEIRSRLRPTAATTFSRWREYLSAFSFPR